jgi:hypothetical protein
MKHGTETQPAIGQRANALQGCMLIPSEHYWKQFWGQESRADRMLYVIRILFYSGIYDFCFGLPNGLSRWDE